MRVYFAGFTTDQGEGKFGVLVLAATMKRVGEGKLYRGPLSAVGIGAKLVHQDAIFICGVGVALLAH